MTKILIDFNRLSHLDLRNFAELIFSKMNDKPKYSMFQTLVVAMEAITTDYKAAQFAEDGSTAKREAKNALRNALKESLTKLAKKVEVAANDLPEGEGDAYAKEAGFTIKEGSAAKKAPVEFLETPTSFKASDDDRPFAALLAWERVAGAKTYFAQELNKDGVWRDCGATGQLFLVVDGTETDVKRTFRIKAINASGVMSSYTREVNVWVY